MMKNRQLETKFITNHSNFFSDKIIPMVEIINLSIRESEPTLEKEITLFDQAIEGQYFVDLFTFDDPTYRPYTFLKVSYSKRLSSDFLFYQSEILKLCSFKRAIPVVSIRKGLKVSIAQVQNLIRELKKRNKQVAVRISLDYFDTFFPSVGLLLEATDYIMLDIGQNSYDSSHFYIQDLSEAMCLAKKILAFSSRDRKQTNGIFEDGLFTKLIDKTPYLNFKDDGFMGIADYCDIKDDLPNGGGGGMGAALGLFFNADDCRVFSIVNKNVYDGLRGYHYVITQIKKSKLILDLSNDCPAYRYVMDELDAKGKTGNWSTWKYVTILRHVSQMEKIV